MSTTPEVYFERQWGHYPKLAGLLAGRMESIKWTGPNSAADNIFEHFNRLMRTYALVEDSSIEVMQLIKESSSLDKRAILEELDMLRRELNWAKGIVEDMCSSIHSLIINSDK